MGESGPSTFVQTPCEISANPLKTFFIYRGCPMYAYCNFYCSSAKKNCSDPPLFLGWRRRCLSQSIQRCIKSVIMQKPLDIFVFSRFVSRSVGDKETGDDLVPTKGQESKD